MDHTFIQLQMPRRNKWSAPSLLEGAMPRIMHQEVVITIMVDQLVIDEPRAEPQRLSLRESGQDFFRIIRT
jgi:hypothetical protein